MPGIQEYFIDSTGHALVPFFSKRIMSTAFYITLILGGLTILTWPWQGFVIHMKDQRVPFTFPVVFIGLFAIQTYMHLRLGRGEIGINYHFTHEKIHQQYLATEVVRPFLQYGFVKFCFQIVALLLPALPILLLATAISGFSLLTCLKALSVVATAALICRLWGFWLYELWGNASIFGYFLARIFLAGTMYLTGFLKTPINPLRVLYQMDSDKSASQSLFEQPYVLYILMAFGCILLLVFLCEWSGRHNRRKSGLPQE
jgi:hypothetical protein